MTWPEIVSEGRITLLDRIIQGDCLLIMPSIPDKSIDMILCDLPYGTTACHWDTVIPFEPLWVQYKRIIKDNGAIVLTASQPFTSALVMSNINMFRYEWIWEKSRASNIFMSKYAPMKKHENICVFYQSVPTFNPIKIERSEAGKSRSRYLHNPSNTGKRAYLNGFEATKTMKYDEETKNPESIVYFNNETGLHPTQKPVALFEYLIKTYTNEGDLVLDNCAGSGTTAVACKNLNRRYILIEKEEKYCRIAEKRIAETVVNGVLDL
jgi:site-specific DNA-methyltransferase (adenine-specific)